MMIRQLGNALSVCGHNASYVIEPLRFTLGFTRCQMIDDHLTVLAKIAVDHQDIDVLLDARRAWAGS